MKVACLQFAPELGKPLENMEKADQILVATEELSAPSDGRPLWLVLPELAFSGYNFQSLDEIQPFLEPGGKGSSTQWAIKTAQHYHCYVTVGYPEIVPEEADPSDRNKGNYNSTVTISPSGDMVAHCRKCFLYYTDETWASEGKNNLSTSGFFANTLDVLGPVAMGICMDINPYRFTAPWTSYEFANHVLETGAQLVVVSMAWLTRLTAEELAELPLRPNDETLTYWIERFFPLQQQQNRPPIFIVLANRCGIEGSACYAGTSSVICFREGRGFIYDVLGKWDEQCMVVDFQKAPKYELRESSATMIQA